ncbi:MAG: hypothetical protein AMXMBFR57_10520 [Acidimicrobiia bacterium]
MNSGLISAGIRSTACSEIIRCTSIPQAPTFTVATTPAATTNTAAASFRMCPSYGIYGLRLPSPG